MNIVQCNIDGHTYLLMDDGSQGIEATFYRNNFRALSQLEHNLTKLMGRCFV